MREDRKKITVYMTDNDHKTLKINCVILKRSMNRFINEAIREKTERERKEK